MKKIILITLILQMVATIATARTWYDEDGNVVSGEISSNGDFVTSEEQDAIKAEHKAREDEILRTRYESRITNTKKKKSASHYAKSHSSTGVTPDGAKRISSSDRFGCSSKKYMSKLTGYASQNDMSAFSQGLTAGIVTGRCTMFKVREVVFLTDTAIFSGLVKVRRQGSVTEYWTHLEAIR